MLMGLYLLGLYMFMCITLHGGGLKKGKNGGDPYGFYLIFAFRILWFSFNIFLNFHGTFKLVLCPGKFSFLFCLVLFTVHIRPVLSPCQAGYTIHIHLTYIY